MAGCSIAAVCDYIPYRPGESPDEPSHYKHGWLVSAVWNSKVNENYRNMQIFCRGDRANKANKPNRANKDAG